MKLVPGMVIAIEPMVTIGSGTIMQLNDEGYGTVDKTWAAHFEHTVAIAGRSHDINQGVAWYYLYMAQPYLSIIVPAYNEAERIPATLIDMDKRLSGVDYSYEILVVNDGSKDATASVVKNMAKMVKNLKLIDLKDNAGKGGAVRQGMLLLQERYASLPTRIIRRPSINSKI